MNGLPNGHSNEEDKSSGGGMYQVNRPYVISDIQLPNVMYQVDPINKINELSTAAGVSSSKQDLLAGSTSRGTLTDLKGVKTVSSTTMTSPLAMQSAEAMNSLEERQEKIISKLKSLQEVITNIHQQCMLEKANTQTSSTSTTALNDAKRTGTPRPSAAAAVVQKQENWDQETIDVVIHANPANPPFSLIFFVNLFEQNYANAVVSIKSHIHSSFKGTINLDAVSVFSHEKDGANFKLSLVWKNVPDCVMMVTPIDNSNIVGEANIARFLSRLLPTTPDSLNYDCLNWDALVKVDRLLEISSDENVLAIVEKELKSSKNNYVTGKPSIADLVLYSAVANTVMHMKGTKKVIPAIVKNWFKHQETSYVWAKDKDKPHNKDKNLNIRTD